MTWRHGLPLVLLILLAAGCATTPTAAGSAALSEGRPAEAAEQFREALAKEPERLDALIDEAMTLLRGGPVTDAVRTYVVASLDYAADWSRELAETRHALRSAQLAADSLWSRPSYSIIRRR